MKEVRNERKETYIKRIYFLTPRLGKDKQVLQDVRKLNNKFRESSI